MNPSERLLALLDHLRISTAHVAAQMAGDIAGLAECHTERLGGIVLALPTRLISAPFQGVAQRLLIIASERGASAQVSASVSSSLPSSRRHFLAGYEAQTWTDAVAERTREIAGEMIGFLESLAASAPSPPALKGWHAGISYEIAGTGPALLLLPFFLAPSQWAPAVPILAERFSVITLGGPHLGGVAALEDRARTPSYRAMFRTLLDLLDPQGGESILEVGCGAGSLVRLLAASHRQNSVTAADLSPFLLREAKALAKAEELADRIRFAAGNATSLPFADGAFDCVYSVTVLEECEADRALAEIWRVTRQGGRIAVAVRALDLPQWWNLDLPQRIAEKVAPPPRSIDKGGVADKSLYHRMRALPCEKLVAFPYLVTLDNPEGPIWKNREDHALSLLSAEERAIWEAAAAQAKAEGLLFMAHPIHCAVGQKPLA